MESAAAAASTTLEDPTILAGQLPNISAISLMDSRALLSGWLVKQGGHGLITNWRRRWFILTAEKTLFYYKSPTDEQPVGMIDLRQFTHIDHHLECKKSKFCWALSARPCKEMISTPLLADAEQQSAVDVEPISPSLAAKKNSKADRIYYAYASNQEELDQWLNAIRSQLPSHPPADNNNNIEHGSAFDLESVPPPPPSLLDVPSIVGEDDGTAFSDDSVVDTLVEVDIATPPVDEQAPIAVDVSDEQVPVTDSSTSLPASPVKEVNEEPSSKRFSVIQASPLPGVKLPALPLKFAELDAKMQNLAKLPREELPVVHDMLRMVYAMVQREYQMLTKLDVQKEVVGLSEEGVAEVDASLAAAAATAGR